MRRVHWHDDAAVKADVAAVAAAAGAATDAAAVETTAAEAAGADAAAAGELPRHGRREAGPIAHERREASPIAHERHPQQAPPRLSPGPRGRVSPSRAISPSQRCRVSPPRAQTAPDIRASPRTRQKRPVQVQSPFAPLASNVRLVQLLDADRATAEALREAAEASWREADGRHCALTPIPPLAPTRP